MPDMFIELASPPDFDDLPEDVIDIPFMEEDDPDIFMPDIEVMTRMIAERRLSWRSGPRPRQTGSG